MGETHLCFAVDRGGPFGANTDRTLSYLTREATLNFNGQKGVRLLREQGVGSSILSSTLVDRSVDRND